MINNKLRPINRNGDCFTASEDVEKQPQFSREPLIDKNTIAMINAKRITEKANAVGFMNKPMTRNIPNINSNKGRMKANALTIL